MFEKDRLNILSALEAVKKISEYTKGYHTADDFYHYRGDGLKIVRELYREISSYRLV